MLKLKKISRMKNPDVIYSLSSKNKFEVSINANSNDNAKVTYIKIIEIREFQILVKGSLGKNKKRFFFFNSNNSVLLFFMDKPADRLKRIPLLREMGLLLFRL